MELIKFIELLYKMNNQKRIIRIGGILAWPAFPGNSVSRIFGINRILEIIPIILIIPIEIVQILRSNSINSKNSY